MLIACSMMGNELPSDAHLYVTAYKPYIWGIAQAWKGDSRRVLETIWRSHGWKEHGNWNGRGILYFKSSINIWYMPELTFSFYRGKTDWLPPPTLLRKPRGGSTWPRSLL